MPTPSLTSLQNPRVKEAVKLRDRRGREKQGRILIEGIREIGRAVDAGVELTEVFCCEPLCTDSAARELLKKLRERKIPLLAVNEQVMLKLAFGDREEGLLAVARPPVHRLADLSAVAQPIYAVLEGIEKPGNLGAILRTAD